MRKLILFTTLIVPTLLYSQDNLKSIRELYYSYKADERAYEQTILIKKFDDVNQTFTFYHKNDQLFYVTLEHSSEFQGFGKEYFFKDDKVFFIYSAESGENYFGSPIRKYWQTDYRYYIVNEVPIQILMKKGEIEGSSNLDSLLATIPNKNVYPAENGFFELELENSRALLKIFEGIVKYR